MDPDGAPRSEAVRARLRACFPIDPVPPYPPGFGLDPSGVDEYAGFADRPWTEVEPHDLGGMRFDICAAIGFSLQTPPHLFNYYVPAFLHAGLVHDAEHEILDSILWRMREHLPGLAPSDSAAPWWHGARHFANYSREQSRCLVEFLEYVRDNAATDVHGARRAWYYDWEVEDTLSLEAWRARAAAPV